MDIASAIRINQDKTIEYIGPGHGQQDASYFTVLQFHRFAQAHAAQLNSTGDDFADITRPRISERSTDNIITLVNGYTIDDTLSEHLYDGTIVQSGGATIYDGILVYANQGMDLQIIQSGAIISNAFWNTVPFGSTAKGLNASAANGISHRFLLKVRTGGVDIDGRRIIGKTAELGKSYSAFKINGTSRGNNVLALTYVDDLNNQTPAGTIAGWNDITLTPGYTLLDVDANGTQEPYYGKFDLGSHSINAMYERAKWLTRTGSASTLYGLPGAQFLGITHEIPVDTASGTWPAYGAITWPGGTGQMLAINHATAPTLLWMQILTGTAPTDNTVITGPGGQHVSVNGVPIDHAPAYPFVGLSTGTALIGAYGIGVDEFDLTKDDKLTDLGGALRLPPNYATFSVLGLVAGEDQVVVGPLNNAGDGINEAQLTLVGTYTGAAVTSISVAEPIPSDTPSSGHIRVQIQEARFRSVPYTSWAGSTFTIPATNFSGASTLPGGSAWIAYIDQAASGTSAEYTAIYSATRDLYLIVRDGGASPTKGFETPAQFGPSGGSVTIVRQSDE